MPVECPQTSLLPNLFHMPGTAKDCLDFSSLASIPLLIANLIQIALTLSAVLAVIFIIVAGIRYITSQGGPDGVKQAKSTLTNAIIGLIVSAAGYLIVGFVARSLLG